MDERLADCRPPEFDADGLTRRNWMCQYWDGHLLGMSTDLGAFTCRNAKYGVEMQEDVQIGSQCSRSTTDGKKGEALTRENAKVGTHSVVTPGVTVRVNAVVGAFSLVTKDVPDNFMVAKVPGRIMKGGA